MGTHKTHKMRDTSLLAYSEVIENLGEKQMLVFRKLRELKFASNFQLSKELRIPVNRICPRIKELRDYKIVMFYKKDICQDTNKLVTYWKPRFWEI